MDISAIAAIRALDGLLLRQTVTANNIANANSEGFIPSSVSFESALNGALTTGGAAQVRQSPIVQFLRGRNGNAADAKVRVDQEVASMSETTMNYLLLSNMLDRKLSTIKLAMGEGRGA